MFFEGVSSLASHLTYSYIYDKKFDNFSENTISDAICYFFSFFIINLTRFYLSKFTNLLNNIFMYQFVNVYFEQKLLGDYHLYDNKKFLEYILISFCIFIAMSIYNELIILNFPKGNNENNNDENNDSKSNLIDKNNENNIILNDNKNNDNNDNENNDNNIILSDKKETNEE
jgi:hypothetical protein